MKKIAIPNFTDDESDPFWWDKFASDIGYLDIQEYQYDEYAKILTNKANNILLEYNATFELSLMADPSAICDYAVITFKDEAKYNWFLLKYT
jgi:hypothetical protein